ncbi:MAG: Crp/Fnr family transcriptional regulator [Bacteroidia bacterium]|nr:Crp/Fnr family transcriptional regulator [Bacteroidia bacterium]MDW8158902.1 Crp/Fnr family transcriptional regulator [Bacteroidia bacterium]
MKASSIEKSQLQLSPELQEKLKEFSIIKHYPEGTVLMNENDRLRYLPIIIRGSIRVMRTEEDGREILLYYVRAGESCIMSLLGGLYNEASKIRAEVEEEAEIYLLPVEKANLLIKEYPELLEYLFKLYHKRFEELLEVVNAVAFKKVDERLLLLLKKKAELTGQSTISITHEQLANELGTARVVVSRLLKQLEENGVVKLGRNKIILLK